MFTNMVLFYLEKMLVWTCSFLRDLLTVWRLDLFSTFLWCHYFIKGEVHFQNENCLIYSPPCDPRCSCLSFFSRKQNEGFWGKHSRIFPHIVDFNGGQRVEGPNCSSKGSLHHPSRGKRDLSSETIGHFLRKYNLTYFLTTNACLALARPHALHYHACVT